MTKNPMRSITNELKRAGLLLETDSALPSVAAIVAGAPVRGSWWAHPKSHEIYAMTQKLAEHPDALMVKLLSGKSTWVHRDIWPEIMAIGTGNSRWQIADLSLDAWRILNRVNRVGLVVPASAGSAPFRQAVNELEARLLIHTSQVHLDAGTHAKQLESWGHWAHRVGLAGRKVSVSQGKKRVRLLVKSLNEQHGGNAALPWKK